MNNRKLRLFDRKWINRILIQIENYLLGIIPVSIYLFICFHNPEIFPDWLNLSEIDPSGYFELIILSTASIFGILIAVILLSFEFTKQSSLKHREENILSNKYVTNIVSIAVSIIILGLISYSQIQVFNDSYELTLTYFIGLLFIAFIILIYPASRAILGTTNTLRESKKQIKSLGLDHFNDIYSLSKTKFISKDNTIALVNIRHELTITVRDCDYEAYTVLLQELNNKAIELIDGGQNRQITDTVFRGLSFIWKAGNFEALRVGNYQYFDTIWECVEELYEFASKNKIQLINYQFIEFFIRDFIKFLMRNKLGDSLASGVKILMDAFKQNLELNSPPQEELSDLYYMFEKDAIKPDHARSSTQWDCITNLLHIMGSIQSYSIQIVDTELFDTCQFEYDILLRELGYNKFDIQIYQEAYIVKDLISFQTYYAYMAMENGLLENSGEAFRINTGFISDQIVNEKMYIGLILQDISDFIIKSQRIERLHNFYTLNYWGAIGRHISEYYLSNKTAQKTMEYVLDTFDVIKTEIEEHQLPGQAKNYNEIKEQLKSIKQWLLKNNKDQEIPILKRIDKLIDNFKEINDKVDFRIVKWEDEE